MVAPSREAIGHQEVDSANSENEACVGTGSTDQAILARFSRLGCEVSAALIRGGILAPLRQLWKESQAVIVAISTSCGVSSITMVSRRTACEVSVGERNIEGKRGASRTCKGCSDLKQRDQRLEASQEAALGTPTLKPEVTEHVDPCEMAVGESKQDQAKSRKQLQRLWKVAPRAAIQRQLLGRTIVGRC